MTLFDLLFIVLVLVALATLVVACISAVRGQKARASGLLRRLAICAVVYTGIVYAVTALSPQVVLRVGDPLCDDDWCLAVDNMTRMPMDAIVRYDVTLRIFSRARRVAQREMGAKDVYLVDAQWRRYDPVRSEAEVPLNTLLQAGESVMARRRFELPADARGVGLLVDRSELPICLIIGECGAFHKAAIVRMD